MSQQAVLYPRSARRRREHLRPPLKSICLYCRPMLLFSSFAETRINSWPFTFEFISLYTNTGLPTGACT
jgi:hypothetical protein